MPVMLTAEQRDELRNELVKNGTPVRFLLNGQSFDIDSGELLPKGTLIMHQMFYWGFTRETSKKIAKWLGVKPVFSNRSDNHVRMSKL